MIFRIVLQTFSDTVKCRSRKLDHILTRKSCILFSRLFRNIQFLKLPMTFVNFRRIFFKKCYFFVHGLIFHNYSNFPILVLECVQFTESEKLLFRCYNSQKKITKFLY